VTGSLSHIAVSLWDCSATDIEAFVWLVDVAGLPCEEAAAMLRWSARAMLRSALSDGFPPP
jgi:hypothetical protein